MNTPDLLHVISRNSVNLYCEVQEIIKRDEILDRITDHGESALRVASNNGRFDVVKLLLDAGAAEYQLEWTEVMHEVVFGTTESMKTKIVKISDLETTDFWSRTPFLLAVQLGDIEKASSLLALGANRNARGRCGATAMGYAIRNNHVPMLQYLMDEGFDIESTDDFLDTPIITAAALGKADCVKFLIENGADIYKANHIPERAIEVATSIDVVRILVDSGEDINDISKEMHAELLGVKHNSYPEVSKEEYLKGRYRQFGQRNAIKTENPFWIAMIRSGASAWRASQMFSDDSSHSGNVIWCYQRYGRSTTLLPDGRIIEIGGEHEDYYDPDFCIYNDVTVFDTNGDIHIYSYATEVFPPTDFHTATLVGKYIYIIGSLGYDGSRKPGYTPVYKLNINTFKITKLDTSGNSPGWISHHKARLKDKHILVSGGKQIVVREGKQDYIANSTHYRLSLETGHWSLV